MMRHLLFLVLAFLFLNASGFGCDPDETPPPAFAAGCAERGGTIACTARGFNTECRRWTCTYTSNLNVETEESIDVEGETDDAGTDGGGIDASVEVARPFGNRAIRRQPTVGQ